MRSLRFGSLLAALAMGLGGAGALASDPAAATGEQVALLATSPGATTTSLYLQRTGDAPLGAPVATFTHLADAVVRGAVIPDTTTVIAAADTSPSRDPSFAASLFRIAPHAPPALLCDRVVHASRPLVTASGRVLVSRGVAGPDPASGGQLRVDELSVDEVDPTTGAIRVVHSFSGHLLFLAAPLEHEIVLYRIAPSGADLVAVDPSTGDVRVLLPSFPAYARDFSVDLAHGALWFQNRHETDTRRWVVDRLDLVSGKLTRVHESASMNLAPHAWPGGGVALNPDGRSGLALLGASVESSHPLGAGVDVAVAESQDGATVALLHTLPSRLPIPFALDARTGEARAIAAPEGARVAIAGFVPATGGGQ